MTTMVQVKQLCIVCGEISNHTEVKSTSTWGEPDLDTRPPEMLRSTIPMWVQRCPFCGYCAAHINREQPDKSFPVLGTDNYFRQLNRIDLPKLANSLLCKLLIEESMEQYVAAGWTCVHAAWVCDDENVNTGARESRMKAVNLFLKVRKKGQRFSEGAGVEEAIMADLLRRAGQFGPAFTICEEGLKKKPNDTIVSYLEFQRVLVKNSDLSCHTVKEAKGKV